MTLYRANRRGGERYPPSLRRRSDGLLAAIFEPAATDLGLAAVRADGLANPGQITPDSGGR